MQILSLCQSIIHYVYSRILNLKRSHNASQSEASIKNFHESTIHVITLDRNSYVFSFFMISSPRNLEKNATLLNVLKCDDPQEKCANQQ